MHSSKASTGIFGLNTKLTLLVLIPSVILGLIGIGTVSHVGNMSSKGLQQINLSYQESGALIEASDAVYQQVSAFRGTLIKLVNQHQRGLLMGKPATGKDELQALERQASALAETTSRELASIKDSLGPSLSTRPDLAEEVALFERRYHFVNRNARNLPRLLEIFSESHRRTATLLAEGASARAQANYIFEENARVEALKRTVVQLNEVLNDLDEQASKNVAANLQREMAVTEASIGGVSTATLWSISIAVVVIALLAIIVVRAMVSRPVGNLTEAMGRLAEGQLDAAIEGERRQDEIGEMARALQVFKTNAAETQRLQAEEGLRIKTEADENERKRQRHEVLGKDIVNLVEQVTGGDLSQRLATGGRTGILEEVCEQINQLVDGLETVLRDVNGKIEALASGDLKQRVTADYQGAFGELKDNVNLTANQLAEIVAEIQTATGEVNNAASEIASGTSDLSTRTEQAAANIEETAASTEELAATVRQNAESAWNASELAETANRTASKGGEVVERAVSAMSGIEESARKITDIISVIDEIAFQTNLLALNASVEAARAGEAGKGFAVVAQEVRQLAQRSAQAASDIKGLIQGSNGQVKDGVELVNQAGKALGEIVGSVDKVTSIVKEISSASQEQASGVQEINNAVTSMDEMTQQNSALVEESTAAARALSDQAGTLTELMNFFKLDQKAAPRTSRKIASPPPAAPRQPHPTPITKQTVSKPPTMAAAEDDWSEF